MILQYVLVSSKIRSPVFSAILVFYSCGMPGIGKKPLFCDPRPLPVNATEEKQSSPHLLTPRRREGKKEGRVLFKRKKPKHTTPCYNTQYASPPFPAFAEHTTARDRYSSLPYVQ